MLPIIARVAGPRNETGGWWFRRLALSVLPTAISEGLRTNPRFPMGPSMRRPIPVKSFFCSFRDFFHFFPFSQAASVATLPSALVVERFSLGASWVFLIQQVLLSGKRPLLPFLGGKLGRGPSRSHLNSAVELGCSVQAF